jgi:hypothetical protein
MCPINPLDDWHKQLPLGIRDEPSVSVLVHLAGKRLTPEITRALVPSERIILQVNEQILFCHNVPILQQREQLRNKVKRYYIH